MRRLEEQLNQAQAANSREVEQLREELHQARDADNAAMVATSVARFTALISGAARAQADLESVHRKIDQERTEFELA